MKKIFGFSPALAGIAAILVCMASALSPAAQAGVLPLRVSGEEFDAAQIDALSNAIEAKFGKYPDIVMMPIPDEDPLDVMLDAGCEDLNKECLVLIGRQYGADSVLYTTVAAVQGQFRVAFRYVEVDTGKLISVDRGASPGDDPAAFVAFSLEEILGNEPGSVQPPPPPPAAPAAASEVRADAPSACVPEPAPAVAAVTPEPAPAPAEPVPATIAATPAAAPSTIATAPAPAPAPVETAPAPAVAPPGPEPVQPASVAPAAIALDEGGSDGMLPVETRASVKKEPFYKTWWFWTIIGVAVVGAGTVAGVLATQDGEPGGQVGFSPDPGYAPLDVTLFR